MRLDRQPAALEWHEAFYTVGPDGFSDLVMGQGVVHPNDVATWMTRVLDMAMQKMARRSVRAAR